MNSVRGYLEREARHLLGAMVVAALVALGTELSGLEEFRQVLMAGFWVTVARSMITAALVTGQTYLAKRRKP